MTKHYRLKPRAVKDLEGIYSYSLRGWGNERADQYIRDIFSAFRGSAGIRAQTDIVGYNYLV